MFQNGGLTDTRGAHQVENWSAFQAFACLFDQNRPRKSYAADLPADLAKRQTGAVDQQRHHATQIDGIPEPKPLFGR